MVTFSGGKYDVKKNYQFDIKKNFKVEICISLFAVLIYVPNNISLFNLVPVPKQGTRLSQRKHGETFKAIV